MLFLTKMLVWCMSLWSKINGHTTPIFVENRHEWPFSIIPKANTYGFLTKKRSPLEIQECDIWQENICGVRCRSLWSTVKGYCWGLVLNCYELRTRQHKSRLMVNALRPSKHYFPKDIMIFGRRLWRTYLHHHIINQWKTKHMKHGKQHG